MTPIETHWNGYRFRSRLEARWAVFFDAMGFQWEYEPEGFVLPSGKRYLPDFKVGYAWVEVKPDGHTDTSTLREFSQGGEMIILLDGPPAARWYQYFDGACDITDGGAGLVFVPAPGKYAPFYYSWGSGWAGREKPFDELPWPDYERDVRYAIHAARGARFEHGESPTARRQGEAHHTGL